MKKHLLTISLLLLPFGMTAQNWNHIRTSGEYYYGVGHGRTELEASEQAMADLVSMIATNVSSEFMSLEDETNREKMDGSQTFPLFHCRLQKLPVFARENKGAWCMKYPLRSPEF